MFKKPNTIKSIRISLLSLSFLLILSNCASNIVLSKEVRDSIKSISINPNVQLLNEIHYVSRYAGINAVLDPSTIKIKILPSITPAQALTQVMSDNQIDIGKLVYQSFLARLKEANIFSIVEGNSDAEFQLEIFSFGLAPHSGTLKNTVKTQIAIIGKLSKDNGQIIWQKKESVSVNKIKSFQAHTLEEYINNPEYLREGFSIATSKAVDKLIGDLIH